MSLTAASSAAGEVPAGTVEAVLGQMRQLLEVAGVQNARVDSELLLGHLLNVDRGQLRALSLTAGTVDSEVIAAAMGLAGRRAEREPLQHITGEAYFRNLTLAVGPGVFVPRPETEIVAQHAIDALMAVASPNPIAVDLCTGSGAIALAMGTEVPHARVIAVELSDEALVWADRNRTRVGAQNVQLVRGNLTEATELLSEVVGSVDVVVTNPPYIPLAAIPRDPEVALHDPPLALYSGIDGMDAIRSIAQTGLVLLRPGGTLVIEHAENQAATVAEILAAAGWRTIAHHRDLTGRDRATTATR